MGNILSGARGWRGGRETTDRHPQTKITNANLCSMDWWRRDVRVRVEAPNLAILICGVLEQPVLTQSTPCHYGGSRRWFLCPRCEGRCSVLHFVGGAFACRTCQQLAYRSQLENTRGRLFRRANAIRARLGWTPGIMSPDGGKPARMHWRTYWRLRSELDGLTTALMGMLVDWIERAEERVDRLHPPGTMG